MVVAMLERLKKMKGLIVLYFQLQASMGEPPKNFVSCSHKADVHETQVESLGY